MRPPVISRSEGRRPSRRTLAGHSGGARRSPRHQTTVAPVAPSDRPSGPKMRTTSGATAGADPDGETPRHTGAGRSPPAPGTCRDGMLGQDRGSVAAVRTPPSPARGGIPGPAPSVRPGTVSGRQCVPAGAGGPVTGTLPRPADPAAAPSAPRRMPWRTLLAAAGGLVLVLAFPGYDLPALAVLGPAALALAVRGRRFRSGLWLGLVFGLAFFVPLLSWTGAYVGSFPWLALAVFEAAAPGAPRRRHRADLAAAPVAALDGGALGRRRGAPRALRPRRLPVGPARVQPDRGTAAVPRRLRRRPAGDLRRRPHRRPAGRGGRSPCTGPGSPRTTPGSGARRSGRRPLLVAAVLAVPLVGALAWLPLPGSSLTAGGPTSTVAVIQGNVPRLGLDFNAQRRAVLDNHVQQTLELARDVAAGDQPQPDLVIWPENSSDIDPYTNADAAREIDRAALAIDAPILVGAIVDGPGREAQQHRDRLGPDRRARATPTSSGTPSRSPSTCPRGASSGSSATRSTWSGATSPPGTRSGSSTSAAPGWATSSASRWSTTGWSATSWTAAPG